jgi:serine/threonine protein kinase
MQYSLSHTIPFHLFVCFVVFFFYTQLNCRTPSFTQIMAATKRGTFEFRGRAWDQVSASARGFIKQALQLDVAERPSAEQLLKHPWLNSQEHNEALLSPVGVSSLFLLSSSSLLLKC